MVKANRNTYHFKDMNDEENMPTSEASANHCIETASTQSVSAPTEERVGIDAVDRRPLAVEPLPEVLAVAGRKTAEDAECQNVPHSSPDDCTSVSSSSGEGSSRVEKSFDELILYQLPPGEQRAARDHYKLLNASLRTGNMVELKGWLANRISALDISAMRCASLKDALLTADLSRKSVRSARDLDALAASSHRRLMDYLEVYMRLERGDRRPVVKIGNAENVAVVAGDAIHENGARK